MMTTPKFDKTFCSQCGQEFGPGDHGFSHCSDHQGKIIGQGGPLSALQETAPSAGEPEDDPSVIGAIGAVPTPTISDAVRSIADYLATDPIEESQHSAMVLKQAAARIDSLTAAEQALINHYTDYEFTPTFEQAKEMLVKERAEKKAAEQAREAAEKDAMRWRYALRKVSYWGFNQYLIRLDDAPPSPSASAALTDEIDAARSQGK
jgi:hypothetical protein